MVDLGGKSIRNPVQQHFDISQKFIFCRGAKIREVCINNNSGELFVVAICRISTTAEQTGSNVLLSNVRILWPIPKRPILDNQTDLNEHKMM